MKKLMVAGILAGFLLAGIGCQQAGNVGDLQKQVQALTTRVQNLEKEIVELKAQVTKLTQKEAMEPEEEEEGTRTGTTTKAGTHRPPARKKTK